MKLGVVGLGVIGKAVLKAADEGRVPVDVPVASTRTLEKVEDFLADLKNPPRMTDMTGVAQAARYYFDRDPGALNPHEMLALAVLARAPSRLDLWRGDRRALDRSIEQLAARLEDAGEFHPKREPFGEFDLQHPPEPVNAAHFLRFVGERRGPEPDGGREARLRVTLDAGLQAHFQALLNQRLDALAHRDVGNAALLAADHTSGEILAWVVGEAGEAAPGRLIDSVRSLRQPGSALKPFLYALGLEKGWTAATLIKDAPVVDMVGMGLHSYRNYSGVFHGPITLRQALGNSLNTPAVRTIAFTGQGEYLDYLQQLGFGALTRKTDHYGPGLALGNGEVSLLELTQAYAALANRGRYREFSALAESEAPWRQARPVVSPEVASLIANILSDPYSRQLEFAGGLLNFPAQTAVKTGTSSDYRDSWAMGFNKRFVVGVWMGNLDQRPMRGVTGSIGPAMVLRAAFSRLERRAESAPLWLSPRLARHEICAATGVAWREGMNCARRPEYFVPGSAPAQAPGASQRARAVALVQPAEGLLLAYDPRVPPEYQAFDFVLRGVDEDDQVDWRIDGAAPLRRDGPRYAWQLERGEHRLSATVFRDGRILAELRETRFIVR